MCDRFIIVLLLLHFFMWIFITSIIYLYIDVATILDAGFFGFLFASGVLMSYSLMYNALKRV